MSFLSKIGEAPACSRVSTTGHTCRHQPSRHWKVSSKLDGGIVQNHVNQVKDLETFWDLSIWFIFLFERLGTSWKEQTGQDSWFMVLQPTPNKDFMLCCHAFLRQGESGKGGTPQIKEKKIYIHHIQQESTKSKEVQISKGHTWKKKTSFGLWEIITINIPT